MSVPGYKITAVVMLTTHSMTSPLGYNYKASHTYTHGGRSEFGSEKLFPQSGILMICAIEGNSGVGATITSLHVWLQPTSAVWGLFNFREGKILQAGKTLRANGFNGGNFPAYMLVRQSVRGKPLWLSSFLQISELETLQNVKKVQSAEKTIKALCFSAHPMKCTQLSSAVGVKGGVF